MRPKLAFNRAPLVIREKCAKQSSYVISYFATHAKSNLGIKFVCNLRITFRATKSRDSLYFCVFVYSLRLGTIRYKYRKFYRVLIAFLDDWKHVEQREMNNWPAERGKKNKTYGLTDLDYGGQCVEHGGQLEQLKDEGRSYQAAQIHSSSRRPTAAASRWPLIRSLSHWLRPLDETRGSYTFTWIQYCR